MRGYMVLGHSIGATAGGNGFAVQMSRVVSPDMFPGEDDTVSVDLLGYKDDADAITARIYYGDVYEAVAETATGEIVATFPEFSGAGVFRVSTTLPRPSAPTFLKLAIDGTVTGTWWSYNLVLR